MNMRKELLPVFVIARVATRRAFRDKFALFFNIIFPLIFLALFGTLFGNNVRWQIRVALINQSYTQVATKYTSSVNNFKLFRMVPGVNDLEDARDKMTTGEVDATIVLPDTFGKVGSDGKTSGTANVYFTENGAQAARALKAVLVSQFEGLNASVEQSNGLPYKVVGIPPESKGTAKFDYTFAGLVGFSIIVLGIFGPVTYFPDLKKNGVLRRLHTTPLRVWQFFVPSVVSYAVIGLVSVSIQYISAVVFFGLTVQGNILYLVLFILFGIISILGIGLALGGWARNQQQSAPLGNIIVFPIIFMSGTFFPRFYMPDYLQTASNYLPLTPIIDGIRLITTESKSLTDLGPQLMIMAFWTTLVYILAFKYFRWE